MKNYVRQPKPPIKLYIKDGEAYTEVRHQAVCGECHYIARDIEAAAKCCQASFCSECGAEHSYASALCHICQAKARKKAEAEAAVYLAYAGPVYIDDTDCYYSSLELLYDEVEPENLPEEVYACDVLAMKDTSAASLADNPTVFWMTTYEDAGERLLDRERA